MYRKILYPIKFEEFSLGLLTCILNFKKAGAEEVIHLYVIYISKLPLDRYKGYNAEEVKKLTEIAELKMEVSLIVLGRQRKGILGEIFIGSNTDEIIRYGDIPVFIPNYPAVFGASRELYEKFSEKFFERILYPTDWSDCAQKALNYLKSLNRVDVKEVIVAHVMDEKAMSFLPSEKFKELKRIDLERLEAVKKELKELEFKVKTLLRVGNPRVDFIKTAKEEEVTLILRVPMEKGI